MFYLDGNSFGNSKELRKYLNWVYPNFKVEFFKRVVSTIECGILPKEDVETYIRTNLGLSNKGRIDKVQEKPLSGYIVYNGLTFNTFGEFKNYLSLLGLSKSRILKIWNTVVPLEEYEQYIAINTQLEILRMEDALKNSENVSKRNLEENIYKGTVSDEFLSSIEGISVSENARDFVNYKSKLYALEDLYYTLGGTDISSYNYQIFSKVVKNSYKNYGDCKEFWEYVDGLSNVISMDERIIEINGIAIRSLAELQVYTSKVLGFELSLITLDKWLKKAIYLNYNDRYISFINKVATWQKFRKVKENAGVSSKYKDVWLDDTLFHTYKDVICYMCESYNIPITTSKINSVRSYMRRNKLEGLEPKEFSDKMHAYFRKLKEGI